MGFILSLAHVCIPFHVGQCRVYTDLLLVSLSNYFYSIPVAQNQKAPEIRKEDPNCPQVWTHPPLYCYKRYLEPEKIESTNEKLRLIDC